ncbi:Crossover junction endonuclease MUS81 [Frankliniella fusca]|uniref:Crossover junction endonuclease MUS81 n=1 Tax=Frankliniella fusca TaxID=407009 RepID=A0AAE1HUR2_9NEOP|nr:Crossover junction endonuclease MUS81 [Frankliniella fusca]
MEPPKPGLKRVTVRPKCPNPLFEKWLEEWRQEAADKGTDMQYCFGKALKSLRKYPLTLRSGKECIILECFGNRLCQLLDRKLIEYRKEHPEMDLQQEEESVPAVKDAPEPGKKRRAPKAKKPGNDFAVSSNKTAEPPEKVPRRNGGRKYVPAWRSGPYAILVTLLIHEEKPNYPGFMLKAELQHEAQPLCDKSFTRPDPGSHYTAWSSMSQLIKKDLVSKCSNPAKFSLTDEGRELAKALKNNHDKEDYEERNPPSPKRQTLPIHCLSPEQEPEPSHSSLQPKIKAAIEFHKVATTTNDWQSEKVLESSVRTVLPIPNSRTKPVSSKSKTCEPNLPSGRDTCETEESVVLESGSFDVLLLVDTCETGGVTKKNHNQTVSELTQMKVPFEVRKLEVGDFLWIARSRNSRADELVLPYIVERKRMDDLGSSIKDNRFKEQKASSFRLKQSGIQNLIYLVESHGSDQHVGLPLSTVQQAAVNTQVVDGFIVKHTIDHRHSMAYLASLTRILGRTFLNKTLYGCPKKDLAEYTMSDDFISLMNFKEFKQCTKKNRNFTVKEMFIRHLIQMNGLSVEKAIAIVERYPTPQAIIQAYKFGGDENLLADIPCLGTATSRRVGVATSKAVHFLYNSVKLR